MNFANELLAAARATKKNDKAAREAATAGVSDFDFMLRVWGSMEIKPDEKYTPTAELPVKLLLAVFLKRSGAIGKANADLLRDIVREAAEANADAKISDALYAKLPELDRTVTEYMQPICEAMDKKTRKGKVMSKRLHMEIVR